MFVITTLGGFDHVGFALQFGRHVFDRLPSYIPHRMKSLVFILVNNQQLTIRETVIKAFVNCLNRCSDYVSLASI